ncbi:MAG TPA: ketosteroid isomerase family protein [Alphaproteobacteria bacterium]|nr:ketosteroid isomerase family protein [Alphaproteobacteria bacterium]
MRYLLGLALAAALLAGKAAAGEGAKLSPEGIRKTMEAYIAAFNTGDAGAVTALYEDGATVEDPAGSAPHKGSQEIGQFYDKVCAHGAKLEPVSINPAPDGSGAMFFQIRMKAATISIIDIMTFDATGKITSMKAYSAITPAP